MSGTTHKFAALILGLAWVGNGYCGAPDNTPPVLRCDQATYARPNLGRFFTGNVVNDDYAFTLNIPHRLTAWDGASEEAPFHGFVVFLDARLQACIVFEIHIRVDEELVLNQPPSTIPVQLGDAKAWQVIHTNGQLTNINTTFSFKQIDQIDDGQVLLIAPALEQSRFQETYNAFLGSLKFLSKSHIKP